MERICESCKNLFLPHPKVPNQKFCSRKKCQKDRRRLWQKQKRQTDRSYKENQAAAQIAWASRNPDYWKQYRENHPGYTNRNRLLQKARNDNQKANLNIPAFVKSKIAKMDELNIDNQIISGRYLLIPLDSGRIAKMDLFIVNIDVISKCYADI